MSLNILNHVDVHSLKLAAITVWSGLFATINLGFISMIAGWVTLAAGTTTVVYNVIRIYKVYKDLKNNDETK